MSSSHYICPRACIFPCILDLLSCRNGCGVFLGISLTCALASLSFLPTQEFCSCNYSSLSRIMFFTLSWIILISMQTCCNNFSLKNTKLTEPPLTLLPSSAATPLFCSPVFTSSPPFRLESITLKLLSLSIWWSCLSRSQIATTGSNLIGISQSSAYWSHSSPGSWDPLFWLSSTSLAS